MCSGRTEQRSAQRWGGLLYFYFSVEAGRLFAVTLYCMIRFSDKLAPLNVVPVMYPLRYVALRCVPVPFLWRIRVSRSLFTRTPLSTARVRFNRSIGSVFNSSSRLTHTFTVFKDQTWAFGLMFYPTRISLFNWSERARALNLLEYSVAVILFLITAFLCILYCRIQFRKTLCMYSLTGFLNRFR